MGVVIAKDAGGEPLLIEVLRYVHGVSNEELRDPVYTMALGNTHLQVPGPIALFQAKIANVAELAQTGRQDSRHVMVLARLMPAHLGDLQIAAVASRMKERKLIEFLERLLGVVTAKHANKVFRALSLDGRKFFEPLGHPTLPQLDSFLTKRVRRVFNTSGHELPTGPEAWQPNNKQRPDAVRSPCTQSWRHVPAGAPLKIEPTSAMRVEASPPPHPPRMSTTSTDRRFSGSIPELYDQCMVPLIFEPYATDLAKRLKTAPPSRLLEVAAGTGAVTRALASSLPATSAITATDLNPAMLERARAVGTVQPVEWQQADAMQLPFADAAFDAVVCQFGVMFFPDKARAFSEVRRVLRPDGVFVFSVWDRVEENEFADTIRGALAGMFPQDPPQFMERTPHGYHDADRIVGDLAAAGFTAPPNIQTVAARSRAKSARDPAIAYCQGTPWRNEIESRDANRLAEATDAAAAAIAQRFGEGHVDGKIQALVVTVRRP